MKSSVRGIPFWTCLLASSLLVGCSSNSKPESSHEATAGKATNATSGTTKSAPGKTDEPAATKPFQLGDLVQPFTPPSLAELDKTAGWIDRPVLSGMDVMRKKQAAAGPPSISMKEAFALRNDSAQNNKKIVEAMGRLAPPDGKGVDYNAVIVRHVGGDMKSSNPLLQSTVTEAEFQGLTGIALITNDVDINYFAPKELIVSWQSSKNHLMDKFVLRDDLEWSDGQPITAKDVEYSFKAIMTEAVPVLAVRTGTDQLKWVQAYDDHTVVIFHKQALATNTVNMEFPIIPQHVFEKQLPNDPTMARSEFFRKLEDHPVVGGPYELVRRVRNQEFVVRRRDNYYMHEGKQVRPKPYFREVRVKAIEDFNTALLALKAGQIDEMELRAEQWISQTNGDDFYARNTKVTAVEWTEFHFDWNCKSPFFSDKRVRQAMSWAFDYDEFLNKICHGLYQPCRGPFHPSSWAFPKDGPKPYHQDLDKAEDLLDQAGWKDSDGDGIRDKVINGRKVPFEFTLYTYQTETGVQCATLMKECLDKIGIICNVKPTEFTVLTDTLQHHKFDASMGGWQSGTDPDGASNTDTTGAMRNYNDYSNKQVDKLFDEGRHEFDPKKRAAIYGEIHNLMWEDQPRTWLFYRNGFYGFNKNVRGYNFSPIGPFLFSPGFDSIFTPAAASAP